MLKRGGTWGAAIPAEAAEQGGDILMPYGGVRVLSRPLLGVRPRHEGPGTFTPRPKYR
jgi:hypothetical protein